MICYIFRDLLTMRPSFLESPKLFMVSFFIQFIDYGFPFLCSFSLKLSVFKMNYHWSVQVITVIKILGSFCLYASCCIPVVRPLVEISLGLNYMALLTNSPLLLKLLFWIVNLPSSFLLNPGKNFLACSSFSKLEALKRGKPKNHVEIQWNPHFCPCNFKP